MNSILPLDNLPKLLPEYDESNLNQEANLEGYPNEEDQFFTQQDEEKKTKQGEFEILSEQQKEIESQEIERTPENSFSQEQREVQQNILPKDTFQLSELNQLRNPLGECQDQPRDEGNTDNLYEDLFISNRQQCLDNNMNEKMSECSSEPANLKNMRVIHQGKHFLMQKSSSSFRYDTFDQDGEDEPDFEELQNQNGKIFKESPEMDTIHMTITNRDQLDKSHLQQQIKQTNARKQSQQSESSVKQRGQEKKVGSTQIDQEKSQSIDRDKESSELKHENQLGASTDWFDSSQINIVNKGPRRPLSPYIFFSQEKRKELKKENPDWSSQQIMKTVSILWQKMSVEEKRDFQEQSKKDRERYETERHDFTVKKDESQEEQHNVLETVKNRSRILKQQQQEKRKESEDYQHQHDNQDLKRKRRESNNLEDELSKEEENFQVSNKRMRKASLDHKLPPIQLHEKNTSLPNLNAQIIRGEDNDTGDDLTLAQQKEKLTSQFYNPSNINGQDLSHSLYRGILSKDLEKIERAIPATSQSIQKIIKDDINDAERSVSNQRISEAASQKSYSKTSGTDMPRGHQSIPSSNTSENVVQQHRILPSPMMSSTSLQNYYNPADQQYQQMVQQQQQQQQPSFIRTLASPQPNQNVNQRPFFQPQFQTQFQSQMYPPQHQVLQQITLQQPPSWIPQGQQLGQLIPQTHYVTTQQLPQDQAINGNNSQVTYLMPQQQQLNHQRSQDQVQLQQQQQQQQQTLSQPYIDPNITSIQAIYPQGNPQNPPHGTIHKIPSSHELASFFQQQQNNFPALGFQMNHTGNSSYFEDQIKQSQQYPQQLQLNQLGLQQYPSLNGFPNHLQQFPSIIGLTYQDLKGGQKENNINNSLGQNSSIQGQIEDEAGPYQHQHLQRLSSANLTTQRNQQYFSDQDIVPQLSTNFQLSNIMNPQLNIPSQHLIQPNNQNYSYFQLNNPTMMLDQGWDNQSSTPQYDALRTPNQMGRQSNSGVAEDDQTPNIDEGLLGFQRNQQ